MQLVCTQLKRENWQGLARLVCLAWTAVEQKPSLAAELAEADAAGVMLGELQQATPHSGFVGVDDTQG